MGLVYQNSLLLFLIATTNAFFSVHPLLTSSCFPSNAALFALLPLFGNAATPLTNPFVHPNFFANFPHVHTAGSEARSLRISAITSSVARGGRFACFVAAEGRMCGGSAPLVAVPVVVGGLKSADAGLSQRENGEGAVGGGR